MAKKKALGFSLPHQVISNSFEYALSSLQSLKTDWQKNFNSDTESVRNGLQKYNKDSKEITTLIEEKPMNMSTLGLMLNTYLELLIAQHNFTRVYIDKIGTELADSNVRITNLQKELSLLKRSIK